MDCTVSLWKPWWLFICFMWLIVVSQLFIERFCTLLHCEAQYLVINECKYSICCKFASSHFVFAHRLVLMTISLDAASYQRRCQRNRCPTLPYHNTDECDTDGLSLKENHWPCFYDWLLFLWNQTCKTIWAVNWMWWLMPLCISLNMSFLESCYSCSLFQILWWYIKVFWQGALLPVVQPHQGHKTLAYSWRLIGAQADKTAPPFLMIKRPLLGHKYHAKHFLVSLPKWSSSLWGILRSMSLRASANVQRHTDLKITNPEEMWVRDGHLTRSDEGRCRYIRGDLHSQRTARNMFCKSALALNHLLHPKCHIFYFQLWFRNLQSCYTLHRCRFYCGMLIWSGGRTGPSPSLRVCG